MEAHNLSALQVWEELRPLVAGEAAERLDAALSSLDFGDASGLLGAVLQELEREI